MLRELSVQNFALIEDVSVQLESGYCVWTGETGAGKSLLLSALELVLGGRGSVDLIRCGRDHACVSAVFSLTNQPIYLAIAAILGDLPQDEDVIITRRIYAGGRSTAHVNGLPVSIRSLKSLGPLLVDLHGQDDAGSILQSEQQCLWLDDWAGLGLIRDDLQARRRAYLGLLQARNQLTAAADARDRERSLLAFETEELAGLQPKAGEYDDLSTLAQRIGQAERIRSVASQAYQLLYESDHSAQGTLLTAAKRLEAVAPFVSELTEAAAELCRLAQETKEVAYGLRQIAQATLDGEKKLDEIEARLASYRRLATRFRCLPDDLAARLFRTENRINQIEHDEADLQALNRPLLLAWNDLVAGSHELSKARHAGAKGLTKAVQTRLKTLGLGQARVELQVHFLTPRIDPTEVSSPTIGSDQVDWMFTPNPGEPARPLREIASGGERSRVTLAIKAALAGRRQIPTLVFDEIDSGVGGRLGSALGRTLKELAAHHQVLCITHLPQLASHADHHWVIRKYTTRGLTRTTIALLSQQERINEVAAMIRGESASESTKREAEAMIAEASPLP